MSDPATAAARDRLRAVYLQHAERRFDEAFGPDAAEIDDEVLQSVAAALDARDLVDHDPQTGSLRVRGAQRSHVWRLAGLNHEYVVQLAVMGRLLRALPAAHRHRLRLEHGKADLVVLGGAPPAPQRVLLQVEVKSSASASAKEAAAAGTPGTPVHARVAELQPERVVFACGRLDAVRWRAAHTGGLGPIEPTTWAEIEAFLRARLGPA